MSAARAETAVDDVMGGKDFDFVGEVEMHTCSSEDEELDLLRPAFANWADQVEYEEAQLLEEEFEESGLLGPHALQEGRHDLR
jgi:hypothetical protein